MGYVTSVKGVTALARECGVSHTHLRLVLLGKRKASARLAQRIRELKEQGFKIRKERYAKIDIC